MPAAPSPRFTGAAYALAAALLFGVSTPFAKALLGSMDPWMLAALLYLGSGLGLAVIRLLRRTPSSDAALAGRDWLWFGGAILAGGIIGPVFLMMGLVTTPAATASLLLNLEGVATALLAWFVFHENFDRRIALGMAAIVAGALVLSWPQTMTLAGLTGPLFIAAACLAWGIDNNLTRKVSLSDPLQIAMLKGLVAGGVNLALALAQGNALPSLDAALITGLVGLAGYGASLALFVLALRHVGTARTGAYFSTAPFIGALVAILWLGEPLSPAFLAAGLLMGVGVWLHLTEQHEHDHTHEAMEHSHRHRHDAHHQHEHEPGVDPSEPHTHWHAHPVLRHSHAHFPDAHHRHRH